MDRQPPVSLDEKMVFIRVALLLMLLAGCQSVSDPRHGAVIRDTADPRIDPNSGRAAGAESFSRQSAETGQAESALQELMQQAQQRLRQGQWWQAIDTAERGLRIDRRQHGFYAILAAAYTGLGKPDRASEFARQGQRYCGGSLRSCVIFQQYLGAN